MNPYISEQNIGEFTFYRVPKALIDDPRYRGVSTDAKLLYALLLDRLSLSLRSGWQDEQGSAYLYYSVAAVREALDCCKEKACKLMRELEDARLIERRAQGAESRTASVCAALRLWKAAKAKKCYSFYIKR